jgi:hypothetical protein
VLTPFSSRHCSTAHVAALATVQQHPTCALLQRLLHLLTDGRWSAAALVECQSLIHVKRLLQVLRLHESSELLNRLPEHAVVGLLLSNAAAVDAL